MLIVPPQLKVFASLAPTDMRKSFNGLVGIVEKELGQQIENGDLFLFFNRRRDRLKVLFFTGDGTVILYKHLERGTFEPLRESAHKPSSTSSTPCLTLSIDELRLLLEGIELSSVKRRARWSREQPKSDRNAASKAPLTDFKK
jgi:transposase